MNKALESIDGVATLKLEVSADDLMKMMERVIKETTNSVLAKLNEGRPSELYTRKEAMKKLGVKSEATMINWEKKGYLSPHKLGNRIFYRQDDLVEALERVERVTD